MADERALSIKTMKEQVYEYFRDQMNKGRVRPGSFLDLNEISRELGISRTPLRDALFQLEFEGFVTIFPRRGVMLNVLTMEKIRHIYEICGALEAAAIVLTSARLCESDIKEMEKCNQQMSRALSRDNFTTYYEANIRFHNIYLNKSDNEELLRVIKINKERLYEFPRNNFFVKEWENYSLREHEELYMLFRSGDFNGAADFMRDVHWSFAVQERFIRKFYFAARRAELEAFEEDAG